MAIENLKETIVAGLEQTKPAKMGLEELVFGNAIPMTFDTETVNVDMYDGTRGEAGYTARGAKGQTVGIDGWTTVPHKPPLINENFIITADDLKVRKFGQSGVNEARGQAKFQTLVNRQILKLKNRKQRAYNKQIAQLITSGTVTVVEKDDKGAVKATRTIDFSMPAAHIYTVGTAWNASADIFGDIRALDLLIQKASGLTPDYAIVGETTLADMMADAKIQALLDNRRINFGEIAMRDLGNGLTSWGTLGNKTIYTFTDYDAAGNPYIPASAYIAGSTQAELDIMYASVDAIVGGIPTIVEAEEVVAEVVDLEAVSVKEVFKSAKLYALTQAGAFGHITTR